MPRLLNPADWAQLIDGLPRVPAAVVMLTFLSMGMAGLRAQRPYLCLVVAGVAAVCGRSLAGALDLAAWYVALPAAAAAAAIVWPLKKYAMPTMVGLTAGSVCGALVANVLHVGVFWIGFGAGAGVGTALAVLAPHFTGALWFAGLGSAGACAALGAVVRADAGLLSPGGYMRYPAVFVGIGVALFVTGVLVQAHLDNRSLAADRRNGMIP